jgi:hypothetical protein
MDYITKIPETPEDYACIMLQTAFELIDKRIQLAVLAPELGAKAFKSAMTLLEKQAYPAIGKLIDPIEYGLVQFCEVLNSLKDKDKLDSNDGDSSWCEILFNCQAFIELILNEKMRGMITAMIPFISEEQKVAMTKDYGLFVNYVCKMSLGAIVAAFIGGALATLYEQFDPIVKKLEAIQGVNFLIEGYNEVLEGAYVYDVLTEYDKFAKCAFTVCDFDKESFEARDKVLKKLFLTPGGSRGYEIDVDASYSSDVKFIPKTKQVENEINARVMAIKSAMQLGKDDPFNSCSFVKTSIKPRVLKRMFAEMNPSIPY